ncbi:MAG: hypothetical protein RL015_2079 [Verrucomicrobiota bacterium]|jgi:hypothetical protein
MKMLTFKKCLAATLALALQITGAYAAISIDTAPQAITAVDGTTVNFIVVASSDTLKPLTYQWWKSASPTDIRLVGKTSNKLTLTGVDSEDAGDYYVFINEIGGGNVRTVPVALTVNVRPIIAVKPASLASPVLEGQTATYDVVMNSLGTPPFTYKWQKKNGKDYDDVVTIVGSGGAVPVVSDNATASVLTSHSARLGLSDVQLDDVGTYRVQVTNVTGTVVNSSDFSLKVNSRPVVITQPAPETIIALGSSKTLKVVVGGNSPMTYQWFKNGVPILKSNSASLSIKATAETPPATPDVYRVEISNPISPTTTDPETSVVTTTKTVSANANVHVIRKPLIQLHPVAPASISVVENPVNQSLSVTMLNTTNPGTYQFQWQKDGKNVVDATITSGPSPRTISGALTNTLSLTPVAWLDRGSYRVIVKNEVGSVTSKSTTLKIVSPPVILSQSPSAVFGNVGGSIKLFVVAGGTSSFKYEWFYRPAVVGAEFGTTPISKSASLTLSKLTAARDGDYYCKVSNLSNPTTGTISSANIFLKVDVAPKVTLQTAVVPPPPTGPAPADYFGNTKMATGGSIRLQVVVSGTDSVENPLRYRWQFNKRDIVGAPSLPTFDLIDAPLTASGKYRCIISNYSGTTTSKELSITVQDAPVITIQPTDINQFEENKLETTAVKASGAATLRYRWEKRFSIPTGGIGWEVVAGQTSTKLSIASSDASRDTGVYRCVVTNDVGSVTSSEIDIIVDPHPVADLGPVSGVSTVDLYPSIARAGEYVRIYGENLRFTKSVKFGAATATPTIESDNAILVQVPATAPTSATAIEVVSKNGSDFTGLAFTRTTGFANLFGETIVAPFDVKNDPTIIPIILGQVSYLGNNQFAENVSNLGEVWYHFSVPVDHKLAINVAGQKTGSFLMDPSLELYEQGLGPAGVFFLGPDGVTRFKPAYIQTSRDVGSTVENVAVTVRGSSKQYLLRVRASDPPGPINVGYGNFRLTTVISKVGAVGSSLASNTANEDGKRNNWQVDGSSSVVANEVLVSTNEQDELRFGGVDAVVNTEPTVIWYRNQPIENSTGSTKISLSMILNAEGTEGEDDQFSWQITDEEGGALFAVWFSALDGSVRLVQADGNSVKASQSILLNSDRVPVEITLDTVSSTWSVLINGVSVADPLPLMANAQFGKISAVWDLGPDGVASGASMVFGQFKVEHSVAP